MCSPGVTLQHICLPDLSADNFHCWGSEEELADFRFAFIIFWGGIFVSMQAETNNHHPEARKCRSWVCLCPPGSVTGICPCRVKECRAWLVTAPRGRTTLRKAVLPSDVFSAPVAGTKDFCCSPKFSNMTACSSSCRGTGLFSASKRFYARH